MKKFMTDQNGKVVNETMDDNSTKGTTWGIGSWLKGLGSYLRPNEPPTVTTASVTEQTNRSRGIMSHSTTSDTATNERSYAVNHRDTTGHTADRWHLRTSSPSTVSSNERLRKCSSLTERQSSVSSSSPHNLPRFKKLPPSSTTTTAVDIHSPLTRSRPSVREVEQSSSQNIAMFQSRYRGVGVMPAIRLLDKDSSSMLTVDSSMLMRRPVTVRIAPPDPLQSPSPSLCSPTESATSSGSSSVRRTTTLFDTSTVITALREKRKRVLSEDEHSISVTSADQTAVKRPRGLDTDGGGRGVVHPVTSTLYSDPTTLRSLKRPNLHDLTVNSDLERSSTSSTFDDNVAKRLRTYDSFDSSSPGTSPSSHDRHGSRVSLTERHGSVLEASSDSLSSSRFYSPTASMTRGRAGISLGGARNLVDVSYTSSKRWLHRTSSREGISSTSVSRDGSVIAASSDATFPPHELPLTPNSRRSSFSSQIANVLNSRSAKSSTPASGRNTPSLSLRGDDGGTLTPRRGSLLRRGETTTVKHSSATVVPTFSSATLSSTTDRSFNEISSQHSISSNDLINDRLYAEQSAHHMIADLDDANDTRPRSLNPLLAQSYTSANSISVPSSSITPSLASQPTLLMHTPLSTSHQQPTTNFTSHPSLGVGVLPPPSYDSITSTLAPITSVVTASVTSSLPLSVTSVTGITSSSETPRLPITTSSSLTSVVTTVPSINIIPPSAGFIVTTGLSTGSFTFPLPAPAVATSVVTTTSMPVTSVPVTFSKAVGDVITAPLASVVSKPGGFKFDMQATSVSSIVSFTTSSVHSTCTTQGAVSGLTTLSSTNSFTGFGSNAAVNVATFQFGSGDVAGAKSTGLTVPTGSGLGVVVSNPSTQFPQSLFNTPANREVLQTSANIPVVTIANSHTSFSAMTANNLPAPALGGFKFGANATTTTANNVTASAPGGFKFGAPVATATNATAIASPMFGTSAVVSTQSMFAPNQGTSLFGNLNGKQEHGLASQSQSSVSNSFGLKTSASTPLFAATTTTTSDSIKPSSSALFTFGGSTNPQPNSFGAVDNSMNPSGMFGLKTPAQSNPIGNQMNANGFSALHPSSGSLFNAGHSQTNVNFGLSSTVPATQSSFSLTGQTAAAAPSFMFGQTPANQAAPSQNMFGQSSGATATPNIFGQKTLDAVDKPSMFGQTQGSVAQPIMFGQTPASAVQPNLFGQTSAMGAQPNPFGQKPAVIAQPNIFGQPSAGSLMGNTAQSASTNMFNKAPSNNPFGAAPSGSINFGGSTTNMFGGNNGGVPDQGLTNGMFQQNNVQSGSLFAPSQATQQNTGFNFNAPSAPSLFQFGNSAPSASLPANTGFSFGATKQQVPTFGMSNGSAPDVTGMMNQNTNTPIGGFSIGRANADNNRPTIKPLRRNRK